MGSTGGARGVSVGGGGRGRSGGRDGSSMGVVVVGVRRSRWDDLGDGGVESEGEFSDLGLVTKKSSETKRKGRGRGQFVRSFTRKRRQRWDERLTSYSASFILQIFLSLITISSNLLITKSFSSSEYPPPSSLPLLLPLPLPNPVIANPPALVGESNEADSTVLPPLTLELNWFDADDA